MFDRIEYDEEVEIGYIHIFNDQYKYKIEETEELEVNEFLALDVDQEQRIIGIEVFDEEGIRLKELRGKKEIFKETTNGYSFRASDKPVLSKFSYNGIDFCFAQKNYTEFVGLDIVDKEKYPLEYLS
ncbi:MULTISPECIES: DUF2283 domain-containing protein [Clostridia]|uniref:DUF2283 domain-containing protein n=1 Tax=Clostridia TaxID=186801 RepID=UPI000EA3EC3F|nr:MULTISPECIES: DUF2283 domain-containing protein [Clostridia]NBJ71712.1 DUF2283 domain-containing protein [Roseburia sp. 1XD42-34]RKI73699.1 DUF2283 domain-containing protein [Clostridium sp. 1xD42-85]